MPGFLTAEGNNSYEIIRLIPASALAAVLVYTGYKLVNLPGELHGGLPACVPPARSIPAIKSVNSGSTNGQPCVGTR